jgi:hypothetical protein
MKQGIGSRIIGKSINAKITHREQKQNNNNNNRSNSIKESNNNKSKSKERSKNGRDKKCHTIVVIKIKVVGFVFCVSKLECNLVVPCYIHIREGTFLFLFKQMRRRFMFNI